MSTIDRPAAETPRREPAYLRIADTLRDRIQSGELTPNTPLPPERELCVEFDVSRMTARRAFTVLEREGLIYRDTTRGTFVAEPRVQLRLGSFSVELVRSGRMPGAEVIWAERRSATPPTARALGLNGGDDVWALQRLRRANGEPLAVETTYYPVNLAPGLLDGDLTGSLWQVLGDDHGVELARTAATLEVITLDATTADQLQSKPTASGLLLTRTTFDAAGRCVEYAQDIYRADRVSLLIDRAINE